MTDRLCSGSMLSARARRRLRAVAVSAGAVATMALVSTSSASALSTAEKEEFEQFASCPFGQAGLCISSTTTGGEFVIGEMKKAVPLSKPILIQGGLAETLVKRQSLIAPTSGEAVAKVPEEVPGGLVGVLNLGGEVTATAELVGPASGVQISQFGIVAPALGGPAVIIPLKVHLSNELLGEDCYIGSDTEPIVLHLTTGNTSPPEEVEPLKGFEGEGEALKKGKKTLITTIRNTKLVDNDFAVPAAKGCGGEEEGLIDKLVNLDIGLPAAAGKNSATMIASLADSPAEYVEKYLPKKKKEKKA